MEVLEQGSVPGWLLRSLPGELRGRPLRYLLVTLLVEAGRPLTVSELIAGCTKEGVVFSGRASKTVSDVLRWERDAGRVKRVSRGVYTFGTAPRSTLYWIRRRTAQTRQWLRWSQTLSETDVSEANLSEADLGETEFEFSNPTPSVPTWSPGTFPGQSAPAVVSSFVQPVSDN